MQLLNSLPNINEPLGGKKWLLENLIYLITGLVMYLFLFNLDNAALALAKVDGGV